jgi:outer membrane biosynthesis protein TonB
MTIDYPNSKERTTPSGPPLARASGGFLRWQGVVRLVLAIMVTISMLALPTLTGAEENRRLRSGDPPEYSELAKKLNIRGIARVQVTIAPDGSIKDVKELGGNPLLLASLTSAVKKWKYEAADKTSVLEVKFVFPIE